MGASKPQSRILELAAAIQSAVANVQESLDANGIPALAFDENAPSIPAELSQARDIILDATAELNELFTEPISTLHKAGRSDDSACLSVLVRFQVAGLVPVDGSTTFAEIARQTPLTEQMVGRIIRHATTLRIFQEIEPGVVVHTRASKLLAKSEINDWTLGGLQNMGPASAKFAEALEKWPGSQEPNETGFSLANNTSKTMYETISQDPRRAAIFATAMKVMASRPDFDLKYGLEYDWGSLGAVQVIDVGGSGGHFAKILAKNFSDLRVIVQDNAETIGQADAGDLADRVSFMAYSFFDRQLVTADVYFFRWVFHNWSDEYCLRILKNQIPALKKGARIVVQEAFMPEAGAVPQWKIKESRSADMRMAYTFNARERTLTDWKTLFETASPSFVLKNAIEPKGSAMGILEFVWEGTEAPQA